MKILVDLDDVLINTGQAWVDLLNERHGTTVKYDDVSKWDVTEFFPTLSRDEIYSPLDNGEVWSRASIIPGARETLEKIIADGHEVFVVTSSMLTTVGKKWTELILPNLPMIKHNNIIVTQRKDMIKGDVLIDDAPFNFDGVDCYCILFDAPHNRGEESSGFVRSDEDGDIFRFVRALNWDDVYRYIKLIERHIGGECNE